jgi:hypothetical protein
MTASAFSFHSLRTAFVRLVCVVPLLASFAARAESVYGETPLQPAFPDHTLKLLPIIDKAGEAAGRASPVDPATPEQPFSWPQVVPAREGTLNVRYVGGFDPGLQPVQIELQPYSPTNLKINGFDPVTNGLVVTILKDTAGLLESLPFRVRARGVLGDEVYNIVFDFRKSASRLRATPYLTRSPGDYIKPGQTVRYTWTLATRSEKRPKVEAEFVGKTGAAKGLSTSVITEVLSLRVRPMVLGHYLLNVTPRDVRGEPARGPTSNGQVFQCAFGSENLAPVADGLASDSFTPAVGQTISVLPVVVDPETGKSSFDNQTFDFGDGTVVTGVSGRATHAYSTPGIYALRCTVADDAGLTATAEDHVIVGGDPADKFEFTYYKNLTYEEAGNGLPDEDKLTATFKGIGAKTGDRIIFVYNRNRFGRLSESDPSDTTDIVLKGGNSFSGSTNLARNVTVQGGSNSISITVAKAHFDRTGDPRFGRSDFKGIFKNQRIAVCVIPADGSAPRAQVYTGNVTLRLSGGGANRLNFLPEEFVQGSATTKEPDPRKQEIP